MKKFSCKQLITAVLLLCFFGFHMTPLSATGQTSEAFISSEVLEYATNLNEIEVMVELKQLPLLCFQQQIQGSWRADQRIDRHYQNINRVRQRVIEHTADKSSLFMINYEYSHVFNGFSVRTDQKGLEILLEDPNVYQIYGINQYYLHREISVPTVGAPHIWEVEGPDGELLTGKDVLVGIIDTGIDYWHPDLGGGIGKKDDGTWYKVRGGFDFTEMHPIPNDGIIAFHGTHVAGIVAGTGEAGIANNQPVGKGVAPEASLMAYKVFGSGRRSTGGDAIIMALEASIKDGCDIVNLSLGKFYGWTEDPLSLVCDRVAEAGVIVVASAGNSGMRDENMNRFPLSSPSSGLKVISVASSDETMKPGFVLKVSEDEEYGTFPGNMLEYSPPLPKDKELYIVPVGGQGSPKDYEDLEVENKVVMVERGGLSFREKSLVAKSKGAAAIIIYNNVPGSFHGTLGEEDDYIPTIGISREDARIILDLHEENPESKLIFDYAQISMVSGFSSQGPTPDFYLKPDMIAPGSNILSSAPRGTYAYASGTSMSAPHVAGGAALMKQLHPEWTPDEIKSLLVNYTDIMIRPQTGKPYSVYKQGAGFMNLERSAQGFVLADPVNLTYYYVQDKEEKTTSFTLSNKGEASVELSMEVWTDDPYFSLCIDGEIFHLEAGENKTFDTTLLFDEDQEPAEGHREFRIFIHYEEQRMIVPGIFYYGEHQPMDHVTGSFMFPTLAISPNHDGIQDSNFLYFLSPNIIDGVQVNIYDRSGRENLGIMAFIRRRMGAGRFAVEFNGTAMGKSLADGMYMLRVYILPRGKDWKNSDNWVKSAENMALIDREPPTLHLEMEKINPNRVEVKGKIEDNRSSLGLFLYYEIDDEEFAQIEVNSDGSFQQTIDISKNNFFIRFTAQDLAGNRTRLKKRIP